MDNDKKTTNPEVLVKQETTTGHVASAAPIPVVPSSDQMTISRSDFDKLISTIQEQNKKIDILYDVADKSRLAKATAGANGEPLIKTVKVRKWPESDKYVVGWKLVRNQSEIINNRWIENQETYVIFNDGSSIEVPLIEFYRKPEFEKAEILSKTRTEDAKGKEVQILKLRFRDGKVIEIDSAFIN